MEKYGSVNMVVDENKKIYRPKNVQQRKNVNNIQI